MQSLRVGADAQERVISRPAKPESPRATSSYLICASPRTGSYRLCEGLRHTGLAGFPTEYLLPSYESYWGSRWGCATFDSYVERALREGTTPNGVFGLKCHAHQFVQFVRRAAGRAHVALEDQPGIVSTCFPAPRYVWLRRADRLRQAVSYAKSLQTKVWWDNDEAPAPYDEPQPDALRFDFALIEWSIAHLEAEDRTWAAYFDANGIEPHELQYEDLVRDYDRAVRRVMAYIGEALPEAFEFPSSRFKRQADDSTARWLTRYARLAEAKRERSIEGLRDIHRGASMVVLDQGSDGADMAIGREQVTIGLGPARRSAKVDYGVDVAVSAITGESSAPNADVVISDRDQDHPFVIRVPATNASSPQTVAVELALSLGASRIGVVGPVTVQGDTLSAGTTSRAKLWSLGPDGLRSSLARLTVADFTALPPVRLRGQVRRPLRVVVYSALDDVGWCAELARCIMAATEHHARFVFGGDINRRPRRHDLGPPLDDPLAVRELELADVIIADAGTVAPADETLIATKPVVTLRQPDNNVLDTRFVDAGLPGIVISAGRSPQLPGRRWSAAPLPLPWWEREFSPTPKASALTVIVSGPVGPFGRLGDEAEFIDANAAQGPVRFGSLRTGHVVFDCADDSARVLSLLGLAHACVVVNNHGRGEGDIATLRAWAGGDRWTPFLLDSKRPAELLAQIKGWGESRLVDEGMAGRTWIEKHWNFESQWDRFWWPATLAALRGRPLHPVERSTGPAVRMNSTRGTA